ncbi:hypothetical protein SAMN05216344_102183 [Polaromonas sp. OV174]|nr:hypothetical protein SAMN05216344_102183 [Polaromonas sp. OV174]
MIYGPHNARGAAVHDITGNEKLHGVVSVDTDLGEVCMNHWPLRVKDGEIESYTARFESIHPIQGLEPRPVLFHCYGRKD